MPRVLCCISSPQWGIHRIIKNLQWPYRKQEMVQFFQNQYTNSRTSHTPLKAEAWPRFTSIESIRAQKFVPAIIQLHGPERKICIKHSKLYPFAFDEEHGHLSYFFSSRLYFLNINNQIECCLLSKAYADPVGKQLYFLKFNRHRPGTISEVEIPCRLSGMIGCPAYRKGFNVELASPTLKVQAVGNTIPPPFLINVSKLQPKEPHSSIMLKEIQNQLPLDKSVRFHPEYDLDKHELVWAYKPGSIPEQPLPPNWQDPNFINRFQRRIHLTYKGFWPKQ